LAAQVLQEAPANPVLQTQPPSAGAQVPWPLQVDAATQYAQVG
jgi:hypothetical protein